MNQDNKNFFEELSKAAEEIKEEEIIPKIELAKASAGSAVKERKSSAKESAIDSSVNEIMDEDVGQLTIDVYQTPTEIVIESTIAGVNPEDLDIDITPESVTIKGKRSREKRVSEEDYYYQECYWGKFSRSVILPQEVDAENAGAGLKNGVLTIKLPKVNKQKSKKLKVRFD